MINGDLRPIAVLFGFTQENGSLTFVGRKEEITIHDYVDELVQILKNCNGLATLDEIRKEVPNISDDLFRDLIKVALGKGILCDSCELYLVYHEDSANPMMFSRAFDPKEIEKLLTEDRTVKPDGKVVATYDASKKIENTCGLLYLINKRKSTRSFANKPVSTGQLLLFLRCIYWTGRGGRSVPSGGMLYPLQIYVATTDECNGIKQVVHQFDPITGQLSETRCEVTKELLARSLDNSLPTNGIIIFVVADLARMAKKYANRGYRLALIEAGHVAQNAYLFAAEHGLGVLEVSAFHDKFTAELLGLDYPKTAVLTVLVVGYEDPIGIPQFTYEQTLFLHQLENALVGEDENKPVEWIQTVQFGKKPYEFQKATVVASFRESVSLDKKLENSRSRRLHRQCTGISTSIREAGIKALAEAYERHTSSCLRVDFEGTAEELSKNLVSWVDPRIYTPYTVRQYASMPRLKEFNPKDRIQWVRGRHYITGGMAYIPVELVYYPVLPKQIGRKPCYIASSNGTAAHVSEELALEKALFELIERDAISVTWYTKRLVKAIPELSLNNEIRFRIKRWAGLGWSIKLLNITLDSLPTVLAVIYSEAQYPHFISGAATARTFLEAGAKALDEAEAMLTSRKSARHRKVNLIKVKTPLDHGVLYFQKENLCNVGWLMSADYTDPQYDGTNLNPWKLFDPVIVNMDYQNSNVPLKVVRVLSSKLIPINFGYGTEHIDHPRIRMLGLKWKWEFPAFPHFFP